MQPAPREQEQDGEGPLPPGRHDCAPVCESYLSTPIASVVKGKIQEVRHIRDDCGRRVPREGDVGCDAGMMDFLSQFAISADVDFDDLIAEVTNTVMWAQGASIEAAFKMAARSRAIET